MDAHLIIDFADRLVFGLWLASASFGLATMLQVCHLLKLASDASRVRLMVPSSCVFGFGLFQLEIMKQPESLILAQDERWRQA